jgi:hypothetical protein
MPTAGDLRERVRFEAQALDENGDRNGAWGTVDADRITMAAGIKTLLGSVRGAEEVMSERLQGRQPVVITVRNCAATRTIDTTWRAVDARSGVIYGLKSIAPLPTRDFIDFLAEAEGGSG